MACSLCKTELVILYGFGDVRYCIPCMERMMRWLAEASQGRITAEGSLVIGAGAAEAKPAAEPPSSPEPDWKEQAKRESRARWGVEKERAALVAAAYDHLKGMKPLSQACECVLCTAARAEMDRRVRAVTAPPESTLTIQTGECGTCGGWKWGHRGPGLHPFAPCPEEERDDSNLRHGPYGYCAPCPACNKQESRDEEAQR